MVLSVDLDFRANRMSSCGFSRLSRSHVLDVLHIFIYFLKGMASSRMGCNLNIVVACGCHVNFVLAGRLFVALGKRLLLRLGMPLVTLWLLYVTSVS